MGIMDAAYAMIFGSLLKARPRTFRTDSKTVTTTIPSATAIPTMTYTASFATCGFPAPNSFETLILQVKEQEPKFGITILFKCFLIFIVTDVLTLQHRQDQLRLAKLLVKCLN